MLMLNNPQFSFITTKISNIQTITLSSLNKRGVWTKSFGSRIEKRRKHVEKAMAWWEDQSQVINLDLLVAFFWLLFNEEKPKNVY